MPTIPEIDLLPAAVIVGVTLYRSSQEGARVPMGVIAAPAQVRTAAKRPGYAIRSDLSAMAAAFARMDENHNLPDAPPSACLQMRLHTGAAQANAMTTLPPGLVAQSGEAAPAFQQLTKRLRQVDPGPGFDKRIGMLGDVTAPGSTEMPSAAQADKMGGLVRIFRTA